MLQVVVNLRTGETRPLTADEKTRILRVRKDYNNRDSSYVLSDGTYISLPMPGVDSICRITSDQDRPRTNWEDGHGNLYAPVRNPYIIDIGNKKIRFIQLIDIDVRTNPNTYKPESMTLAECKIALNSLSHWFPIACQNGGNLEQFNAIGAALRQRRSELEL